MTLRTNMVIQKYTENIYASEVYRELERQAVRKGEFNPTPGQQVKLAALEVTQKRQINQPINVSPTADLTQDVARLAFAMRRKGFVSQAEELEQKLVIYKQAECALYNVTPEKNSDFIQFGHRDGDVEIIEGAGELGTIETIESIADKILAVTRKQPTGKLPGKMAISELANIIKNAQSSDYLPDTGEEVISGATEATEKEQIQKDVQEIVGKIKDSLKKIYSNFQQINDISFNDAMTTFLFGQSGKINVFNALSNNQYPALEQLGRRVKATYKGGEISPQTIENILISNPAQANTYLQSIGVNQKIANKIMKALTKTAVSTSDLIQGFTGMGPLGPLGTETLRKGVEKRVTNYLAGQFTDAQKQQAKNIASEIDTKTKLQIGEVENIIKQVNSELQKRKDVVVTVGKAIAVVAGWNTATLRDSYNFLLRVRGLIGEINGALAQINWIFDGFGKRDATLSINQELALLEPNIKALSDKLGVQAGANVYNTQGRLKVISKLLNDRLGADPNDAASKKTLSLVTTMLDAIRKNQSKGEKAVLSALPGGYSSWKDFDVDTIQLLDLLKSKEGGV